MVNSDEQIADKNILDRTQKIPNAAVMNAVKSKREKLQHGAFVKNNYAREMLVLHTQSLLEGAAIGPILVISVAVASYYLQHTIDAFLWSIFASIAYTILTLVARSAAKLNPNDMKTTTWQRRYYASYFIIGLVWSAFFALQTTFLTSESGYFFVAASLLILTATTATSTLALSAAVYYVVIPILSVLAFHAIRTQSIADVGHLGFQLLAAGFFILLSRKLYQSNVARLEHQLEKDALIAELEVANSLSDEARRRAEEANLAKSRFLASMSHELRTPLNAILGFSEIMKNGVMGKIENPQYVQYMGDIHSSGQHLLNLINEILDLSRIEAGRYELSEESVSLADISSDCIAMVQLKARNKDISIVELFEESLPMVWADEKSIRQVILNLLSNAVKFTPSKGEINIKLGWTAGGGQYLSITDNGTGIPEEEIPIVLSAFGQGSIAIKSAEQGTGLGLPIVQAIMKKHEGNFTLKSKLRVGTTATCTFPAKRVMQSISPVEQTPVNNSTKKRVGTR
ncbi:HAMP domain-containing sensor histidine kinase [Lentilitoribacter sp. Alg239-R112]|uniref:sensor histidine kinase n=1 Tax=Lentilitoribacter sp. Alg239-R112 TaxID=2305987 RepID=UPI0013A70513|nr:HAMP domain-containing sensor histidine kinase [Lentilitoribacter sp. Alg239-R112]